MKFSKTLMMTAFAVLIGSSGTIAQTAPTAKPVAAQRSSTAKSTSDRQKGNLESMFGPSDRQRPAWQGAQGLPLRM